MMTTTVNTINSLVNQQPVERLSCAVPSILSHWNSSGTSGDELASSSLSLSIPSDARSVNNIVVSAHSSGATVAMTAATSSSETQPLPLLQQQSGDIVPQQSYPPLTHMSGPGFIDLPSLPRTLLHTNKNVSCFKQTRLRY
jgi:hypothetical protein